MMCVKCKSKTAVTESRLDGNETRRRRKCKSCAHAFWTREAIDKAQPARKPKPQPPAPKANRQPGRPRSTISDERELWGENTDASFTLRELGLD